jgi:hypothetical protein
MRRGLVVSRAQGLTKAVGVSNFNAERVRNAAKALAQRGTCLSSNQVRRGGWRLQLLAVLAGRRARVQRFCACACVCVCLCVVG